MIDAQQLIDFLRDIEKAHAEIDDAADFRKQVYATAKAAGFDTKVIAEIIKMRRKGIQAASEHQSKLHEYLEAISQGTINT